ncbi:RNA polymerase sigma factor [Lignipirellula cremea]|uniref:ECF RNA polymerase sigma factor SigE n=1 Tax=Lignipirellula cremea TaxID=2528010 RepID=A0A518DNI2_9BACT|nr:sigma-70 family RNA polymerase sigma factor [Lignipirellula cremea]QDU93392.1 ECF RNA polymerase sigma factor SigE [Lignipirellula cremea]
MADQNDSFSQGTSLSLLQRAQANDQDAWERIVRLYGPLVYRWCQQAGVPASDLPDLFQDTFRAVAAGLLKFQPQRKGSFRAWLRTIARSKTANFFHQQNRQPQAQGGSEARQLMNAAADPAAEDPQAACFPDDSATEIEADRQLLVRRAMECIRPEFSARTWQAFEMVALEGRPVSDAAAAVAMSEQAVRQANYRVRRRMRQELEGLFEV